MGIPTDAEPFHILLVEDNPGDVRLTTEALKESKVYYTLSTVNSGEDALAFLRQEGEYSNAQRPDIILLDLHLPGKGGQEVLQDIKTDGGLKSIPVVILTSSSAEEDILKTYNLHANCYITKPVDFNQFVKIVKSLEDFWFTVVKLPPRKG